MLSDEALYEQLIRDINPAARIVTYPEGLTEDNVDRFLADADVVS